MDKLVKRITAVGRSPDGTESVVVYRNPRGKSRKLSKLGQPLEKAARRLLRADNVLTSEALRLHDRSNSRRKDGWLMDGPINIIKAHRKAYNEARKLTPFRLLPKA